MADAVQPRGDGRACCDERVLPTASGRLVSGGGAACAARTASTLGHPRAVSMEAIEVVQGGLGGCHPASHDGSRAGVALGASLTGTAAHLPDASMVSAVAGNAGARPEAECLGMPALVASRELWPRASVPTSGTAIHRCKSSFTAGAARRGAARPPPASLADAQQSHSVGSSIHAEASADVTAECWFCASTICFPSAFELGALVCEECEAVFAEIAGRSSHPWASAYPSPEYRADDE